MKETDISETKGLLEKDANQALYREKDSAFVQFMQSIIFLFPVVRSFGSLIPMILLASVPFLGMIYVSAQLFKDYWGYSVSSVMAVYLAFGLANCAYSVFFSWVPEYFGAKHAAMLGHFLTYNGFVIMFLSMDSGVHLAMILTLISWGAVISIGSYKTLIHKMVDESTKSTGFSAFTASMYLGGCISVFICELLLESVEDSKSAFMSILGVFMVCAMLALVLSALLPQELLNEDTGTKELFEEITYNSLLKRAQFWKLIGLTVLGALVRVPMLAIFTVLPFYMERENDCTFLVFPGGFFIAAAYALTMTGLVYFLGVYYSILIGGAIGFTGPLVLMDDTEYIPVIIYVALVCLSEAILDPRLAEYAADAASLGKSGFVYTVITFGFFLALGISAGLSWALLDEYCPDQPERSCWKVWYAISTVGAFGTALILICKDLIKSNTL